LDWLEIGVGVVKLGDIGVADRDGGWCGLVESCVGAGSTKKAGTGILGGRQGGLLNISL
jgi:hypothetical protein